MPNELSKGEISPRITLMRGAQRRAAKLFLSNKNTQYTWTSRLAGTLRNEKCCAIERKRFSIAIFDMKLLFFDIRTPRGMKEHRSEKIPVLGKSL